MRIVFYLFFVSVFNSILPQGNEKMYSLGDVDEFPVFHQIEFQYSQKNNLTIFQAKLGQFFISNIEAQKLVLFASKVPIVLNISTTFDGGLQIENSSDFNTEQLSELTKTLQKLSLKKAALKEGKEVIVTFSIPLQLKFTEIKTIK